MNEYTVYISYTSDNESMAQNYIHTVLLKSKLFDVIIIGVEESQRACRNAYGKEIDEEDFDNIDSDSDEAWFDDYDMVFYAKIKTSLSEEDLLAEIENLGLYCESEEERMSSIDAPTLY